MSSYNVYITDETYLGGDYYFEIYQDNIYSNPTIIYTTFNFSASGQPIITDEDTSLTEEQEMFFYDTTTDFYNYLNNLPTAYDWNSQGFSMYISGTAIPLLQVDRGAQLLGEIVNTTNETNEFESQELLNGLPPEALDPNANYAVQLTNPAPFYSTDLDVPIVSKNDIKTNTLLTNLFGPTKIKKGILRKNVIDNTRFTKKQRLHSNMAKLVKFPESNGFTYKIAFPTKI